MAIFHFHEKNISRSDGRSVVACAAYRSGEKLHDHTYGKVQNYQKKKGVVFTEIYAPQYTHSELLNREQLWNAVEHADTNKNGMIKTNARLAKEYTCALPHELTDQQRIQLVQKFCRHLIDQYQVIVDAAIHRPHNSDNQNHHVHIMFTTRYVDPSTGQLGKKQRQFNDQGPEILKQQRALFCELTNQALKDAGHQVQVDHRSYKDRDRGFLEPTRHEGPQVTALRRQGIMTEISLGNDKIRENNQFILHSLRHHKAQYQQLNHTKQQNDQESQQKQDHLKQSEQQIKDALNEHIQVYHEISQRLDNELYEIHDQFIEDQRLYGQFMQHWRKAHATAEQQLKKPRELNQLTNAWLEKYNLCYKNGEFPYAVYEVRTPKFFCPDEDYKPFENNVISNRDQLCQQLIQHYDILNLQKRLREHAETLELNGYELPTPKPSFLQRVKLKSESASYQTLFTPSDQKILQYVYEQHQKKKREQLEAEWRLKKQQEHDENARRFAALQLEEEERMRKEQWKRECQFMKQMSEYRSAPKKSVEPSKKSQKEQEKKLDRSNDYTPW